MPIKFDPPVGTVLLCDFATGFRPPEMVKRRPVLVISPRLRHRRGLCTVVPLSTTPPDHPQPHHYKLTLPIAPPAPWSERQVWAKADMLATVAFERLDLFRTARQPYGRRQDVQVRVTADDLAAVRACVAHALGLLT